MRLNFLQDYDKRFMKNRGDIKIVKIIILWYFYVTYIITFKPIQSYLNIILITYRLNGVRNCINISVKNTVNIRAATRYIKITLTAQSHCRVLLQFGMSNICPILIHLLWSELQFTYPLKIIRDVAGREPSRMTSLITLATSILRGF